MFAIPSEYAEKHMNTADGNIFIGSVTTKMENAAAAAILYLLSSSLKS
jgi:hypothetical protein